MRSDNIALIGFMGTGKTSCGRDLAQRLNWKFIEMDAEIERVAGMSVREIFASKGESYFRDLETRFCHQLAHEHHAVISTGGGIVTRPENVQALRTVAFIVLLTATPEDIFHRIMQEGKEKRPLLAKPDPMHEIKKILEKREKLYQDAADLRISSSGKAPEQVATEILEIVKKRAD